ncbi:MAG: DUF4231 domain-containing protein, partial [Kangiellaceae bacterium]|nr:DUF4231 domain-containing protein [Kangiellaceae bacterium]
DAEQVDLENLLNDFLSNVVDTCANLSSSDVAKCIYSVSHPVIRLVSDSGCNSPLATVSAKFTGEHSQFEHMTVSINDEKGQNDSVTHSLSIKQVDSEKAISEKATSAPVDSGQTNSGQNSQWQVIEKIKSHSDVLVICGSHREAVVSDERFQKLVKSSAIPVFLLLSSDTQNQPVLLKSNPASARKVIEWQTNALASEGESKEGIGKVELKTILSEILLFDSLLKEKNDKGEVVVQQHALERITAYAAESSLVSQKVSPDFDYQGPIGVANSLFSWRNIFARFVNLFSPKNTRPKENDSAGSSEPSKEQSATNQGTEQVSEFNKSANCHQLFAQFLRADHLAIKYANAHRSSFVLIYCLGAFALINAAIAIGFSEIGWLALTSALAEFFALVAIFLIYRNDHKKRYHIKWLEYRSLAEILRVSPLLNRLGVTFSTEGLERHKNSNEAHVKTAHSVGRTWLIIYSESIKRWLNFDSVTINQQSLSRAKDYLTEKLLAGQVVYHQHNSHRMHLVGHNLGKFSYVLFVLAFVFVSAKLVTKLLVGLQVNIDPLELHHLGHYFGFLAAVCPMLGSAAFAIRNHAEFDISSQRSQTMLKKLERQRQKLNDLPQPLVYKDLIEISQRTSLIMQSETADWLEIYEVKETEPG